MPAPLLAAAGIAGGLSLLGGLATSALSMQESARNRRFQERLSGSAHQREVADLRAAGLNPILSARHGGASTPPGATGQPADFSRVASTAIDAMSARAQIEVAKAQANDLNSAASLKDTQKQDITYSQQERVQLMLSQARQAMASGELSSQQANKVSHEIRILEQQLKILRLDATHSALDLERAKRDEQFMKGVGGKIRPWMEMIPYIPKHYPQGRR